MKIQMKTIEDLNGRLNYLERCWHERGPFRIAHLCKDFSTKWMPWNDSPEWLKWNATVREIFRDEVILDFDGPTKEECSDLAVDATLLLRDAGYNFGLWSTGSKGFHLHMRFSEMKDFSEQQKKNARLHFIKKYNADPAKQSGLIAIEHKPHFKTGKPKILQLDNFSERDNKLPSEATENVVEYNFSARRIQPNLVRADLNSHELVLLAKNCHLPDGKNLQRWKVVKNLAILAYRCGLTEFETETWSVQFLNNLPGKTTKEFVGWYRWAQSRGEIVG